jgi:hypothetical protein
MRAAVEKIKAYAASKNGVGKKRRAA